MIIWKKIVPPRYFKINFMKNLKNAVLKLIQSSPTYVNKDYVQFSVGGKTVEIYVIDNRDRMITIPDVTLNEIKRIRINIYGDLYVQKILLFSQDEYIAIITKLQEYYSKRYQETINNFIKNCDEL